jgi:hypothetical protein
VIAALEQDHDIILAYLIKAVVQVKETVKHEQYEVLDEFFRRTVNILIGVGTNEVRFFLQDILEKVLRKEGMEDDVVSSEDSSESKPVSSIIVSCGDQLLGIEFQQILAYFWGTQLNSVCHHCHQAFVGNEPPIRTIAKHEQSQRADKLHIRVFNPHFACLEETEIFFVPVSHVWDDSIRRANVSEMHDDEAASTLVHTLETLFHGAKDAYHPGVEFWHDYFSVPQWEPVPKNSLLLRLPAIYHLAQEILVHMSDLTPSQVWLLLLGSRRVGDITLLQALKKVPLFRCLCDSEWMKRMWVTLEYTQSRAACVMDQSNYIHRTPNGDGIYPRDSFFPTY